MELLAVLMVSTGSLTPFDRARDQMMISLVHMKFMIQNFAPI